jgi:hypothetical protein
MAEKIPALKDEVLESVKPCTELLRHVMERLKLKDQTFQTFNPADDENGRVDFSSENLAESL